MTVNDDQPVMKYNDQPNFNDKSVSPMDELVLEEAYSEPHSNSEIQPDQKSQLS